MLILSFLNLLPSTSFFVFCFVVVDLEILLGLVVKWLVSFFLDSVVLSLSEIGEVGKVVFNVSVLGSTD